MNPRRWVIQTSLILLGIAGAAALAVDAESSLAFVVISALIGVAFLAASMRWPQAWTTLGVGFSIAAMLWHADATTSSGHALAFTGTLAAWALGSLLVLESNLPGSQQQFVLIQATIVVSITTILAAAILVLPRMASVLISERWSQSLEATSPPVLAVLASAVATVSTLHVLIVIGGRGRVNEARQVVVSRE